MIGWEAFLTLRLLEEEDPQLRLGFDPALGELRVSLMGEVQAEILKNPVLWIRSWRAMTLTGSP